ncbi:PEP-CTERM sorting domain-containing protein [Kitasatospora sp. NPDC001660]
MLVEGAGVLLLLGGGFGMVGTRRRREAERAAR